MDINQAGIPLGWHMLPKMDSVGSTNTWLKEHAADLPSHSVLIAREQRAGRGRNGTRLSFCKGSRPVSLHIAETDLFL